MNKLPIFILSLLLCAACSTNYPVLEPQAKVFKKRGNEVMFIFNEHEGKRTGYQWFRVDNPDEFQIDSTYYLSPKIQQRALK
ncbi:MAG: hypothetical protein WDZ72_13310 [Cyclobacteriaceae bacterium]